MRPFQSVHRFSPTHPHRQIRRHPVLGQQAVRKEIVWFIWTINSTAYKVRKQANKMFIIHLKDRLWKVVSPERGALFSYEVIRDLSFESWQWFEWPTCIAAKLGHGDSLLNGRRDSFVVRKILNGFTTCLSTTFWEKSFRWNAKVQTADAWKFSGKSRRSNQTSRF